MRHAISTRFLFKRSEKPKNKDSGRDLHIFPSNGEPNMEDNARAKCSLTEVNPAKGKQERKCSITFLAGWSSLSYHMLRGGGNSL